MPITLPPPAPSRNNPATFSPRMDSFLAWLVTAVPEFNALALATGPGLFLNGSAANPGISFAADPDTGLYRPGANQLAAVTGGVTRWLLSNTGMQIDVPLIGTAVTQSPNDTTAGRLLKTGDFGLGTAISLGATDNLDNILTSGVYYNPSTANTTGNNYPSNAAGALQVIFRAAQNVVQIYTTFGGTTASTASLRQYVRSRGTDGWTAWDEILMRDNIVGPASQSAGVPTGAIIERGSNTNGEYVRLADGSQWCWRDAAYDASLAGGANSGDQSWTFPASFLSGTTPAVEATARATNTTADRLAAAQYLRVCATPSGASSGVFVLANTGGAALTARADLRAVGRWY
ncbi:pyocin knob domain-containing protein [Gemmobacter sp. LW-1]|uniref:pyocin knob domain-containing protein n=1 Tax=Gemmobacter sp. LW-1 TaxID=1529005 RepID=UPI00128F4035|nr:pyocin knob domain-containing protein [Gemmobacter sp. LW-1]